MTWSELGNTPGTTRKEARTGIDPYHSATMLSLRIRGIKSFVFAPVLAQQASARREFSARLAVQKQSFLFP